MTVLLCNGPAAAQTGMIGGRLTERATAVPIEGARMRAERADGTIAASAVTDTAGRYRLGALPPGTYAVIATHLAYEDTRVGGVTVAAGQIVNLPIEAVGRVIRLTEVSVAGIRGNYLRTPAAEAVIDTVRIAETVVQTPTEHLEFVRGIAFARTGFFTNIAVARGFSNVFSTSLLAITDNRYTNVPSLRVNTAFLMPALNEDIERIEVLLGPGAALYGPNATNGVMHITTRSPLSDPGTTVSIGGGERDLLSTAVRHAGTIGERFGYKVTGQWMRGREWEFTDQEEIDARAANPALPARDFDLERWSSELRADYRVARDATITLNAGRVTAVNAIELTPFGAAQAREWAYSYYQGRLNAGRLFVQGFLNTSDAGETFLLRTGEPIVDRSRLMAAQVRHTRPWSDRQTFMYGLDFQRTDPRTGGTIHGRFEDDDRSNEIGGYMHSQTLISPTLDLVLAVRYDYHNRVGDHVLSPRAGVVFHPVDHHNFRVTYNRAFSTPLNSQLFLDLRAGSVGALPFQVRAIGASAGYRYRRDCAGALCIRSPFPALGETAADPSRLRDLDATRFWGAATAILYQASGGTVDVRAIPAPTAAQVGTVLRLLNPHPSGAFFQTVDAASLNDIPPLAPSISNTFEMGYKGFPVKRVLVGVDVWHQRRDNFVSAALVETPNAFLDRTTLTTYLANFMSPEQAAQIATAMAGIDGNPQAPGIPLGTAGFDHPFTSDPNVYLTFRNYGDVQLWGSDISVEAALPLGLTLTGSYSWLSDDTFRTTDIAGEETDVLLNAPASRGSLGLRWALPQSRSALAGNAVVRFVDGFPMNSGVYAGTVKGYTRVDAGMTWRVPRLTGTMLTLQAQNVFDSEHSQFIGAPSMARLLTGRITYRFGRPQTSSGAVERP